MRGDLAALIPPLVMAAAFIAGVVALLRKEMAPRRRERMTPPGENGPEGGPHGEMTSLRFTDLPGGQQNRDGGRASCDNSSDNHLAACGTQDVPVGQDDGDIGTASEDHPPAPPAPPAP